MNTRLASTVRFSPRRRATIVEVPTAKVIEIANSRVTNGVAIETAARAVSDTPRATNIPSTTVYSVNMSCPAIAGIMYRKYFFISESSLFNSHHPSAAVKLLSPSHDLRCQIVTINRTNPFLTKCVTTCRVSILAFLCNCNPFISKTSVQNKSRIKLF